MDYNINDDYLDDDDDGIMYSTKNYCSDSDDDNFSAFLPHAKKASKYSEYPKKKKLHEQDDFEKEMAAELSATMKRITSASRTSSQANSKDEAASEQTHYDKIYFDSDEDEEDSSGTGSRKAEQMILTNDELFYDPLIDEADQAWVDNNRRSYQIRSKRSENGKIKPQALPQSDAVLNCPACFTTLCLDCQRHEVYKNQYRAMFVFNCIVDKSERLHFALKEDKKKKFKAKKQSKLQVSDENVSNPVPFDGCIASSGSSTETKDVKEDTFYPVKCTKCNTKVAVQDLTEVYHFFNVLTSY